MCFKRFKKQTSAKKMEQDRSRPKMESKIMEQNKDITVLMHAFFQLPNLEKLKLVESINEYFDSNEREKIRAEHERLYAEIDPANDICKCCGRPK